MLTVALSSVPGIGRELSSITGADVFGWFVFVYGWFLALFVVWAFYKMNWPAWLWRAIGRALPLPAMDHSLVGQDSAGEAIQTFPRYRFWAPRDEPAPEPAATPAAAAPAASPRPPASTLRIVGRAPLSSIPSAIAHGQPLGCPASIPSDRRNLKTTAAPEHAKKGTGAAPASQVDAAEPEDAGPPSCFSIGFDLAISMEVDVMAVALYRASFLQTLVGSTRPIPTPEETDRQFRQLSIKARLVFREAAEFAIQAQLFGAHRAGLLAAAAVTPEFDRALQVYHHTVRLFRAHGGVS